MGRSWEEDYIGKEFLKWDFGVGWSNEFESILCEKLGSIFEISLNLTGLTGIVRALQNPDEVFRMFTNFPEAFETLQQTQNFLIPKSLIFLPQDVAKFPVKTPQILN